MDKVTFSTNYAGACHYNLWGGHVVSSKKSSLACQVHLDQEYNETFYNHVTNRWGYTIFKEFENNFDIVHFFVNGVFPKVVAVTIIKLNSFLIILETSSSY